MNPSLDPTNQMDSMVYRMGQEERAQIAVQTSFGPLPESAFVASARESIPQASIRLTTATSRGRGGMRGRGRGRSTSQTPLLQAEATKEERKEHLNLAKKLQEIHMPNKLQEIHMPNKLQEIHMPNELQEVHMLTKLQDLHMPSKLQAEEDQQGQFHTIQVQAVLTISYLVTSSSQFLI